METVAAMLVRGLSNDEIVSGMVERSGMDEWEAAEIVAHERGEGDIVLVDSAGETVGYL